MRMLLYCTRFSVWGLRPQVASESGSEGGVDPRFPFEEERRCETSVRNTYNLRHSIIRPLHNPPEAQQTMFQ